MLISAQPQISFLEWTITRLWTTLKRLTCCFASKHCTWLFKMVYTVIWAHERRLVPTGLLDSWHSLRRIFLFFLNFLHFPECSVRIPQKNFWTSILKSHASILDSRNHWGLSFELGLSPYLWALLPPVYTCDSLFLCLPRVFLQVFLLRFSWGLIIGKHWNVARIGLWKIV